MPEQSSIKRKEQKALTDADTDTAITPSARAYMPLIEIAAEWAAELPSQKEGNVLRKLLTAFHGGEFASTFLLFQGQFIHLDADDVAELHSSDLFGVAPNFTDPAAYEDVAKTAYLDCFAVERGDFLKWCRGKTPPETAPAFWADGHDAATPAKTKISKRLREDVYIAEMKRRFEARESDERISYEAAALEKWAKKNHEDRRIPKAGRIENIIRAEHKLLYPNTGHGQRR